MSKHPHDDDVKEMTVFCGVTCQMPGGDVEYRWKFHCQGRQGSRLGWNNKWKTGFRIDPELICIKPASPTMNFTDD